MYRRRIFWLALAIVVAFASIVMPQVPFRPATPTQIRVGHDSNDIAAVADRGFKGGYDPYFHRVNFIMEIVPSCTNAMARN